VSGNTNKRTKQIINDIISGGKEKEVKRFPALFVFLGSAAGLTVMYEDGRTEMPEMNIFGGKAFLGLSRCLLGTRDYMEITELASNGKANTDFCIQDILPNVNPYWKDEDPETCLYAFGKLSEDVFETDYSKEDLALSLCRAISNSLANTITNVCRTYHIKKIYIGGNLARAEIIRISILKALDTLRVLDSLDVRFMTTGHTGAIGCLVSDPDKKVFDFKTQDPANSATVSP